LKPWIHTLIKAGLVLVVASSDALKKIGFIKRVGKGWIATKKGLES